MGDESISSRLEWASAFALQALSDIRAREILAQSDADKCHRLHFLQMAAEKVCKAHLVFSNGSESMAKVHCIIAKHLPSIVRQTLVTNKHTGAAIKSRIKFAKRLSREMDFLSPSCTDGGRREQNSEYPWEWMDKRVGIPCTYSFPNIDESDREFVSFLKSLRTAAESYVQP